jgi:hypothetical protein
LVASIMYTFGYKTNKSVIIWGFIIFAAMLSLNILTSIWLFSTYWQINSYTQEAQIELDNNKDITFNTWLWFNEERIFPLNIWGSRINLESITGTTLKVEIKYKFFWNDYLENIFKDTIVKPELVKNGSTIEFENPSMFSEKIPYIPFEKRTIIYVPEWYTIKFSGHVPYITNTYVTFEDKKYKNNNHIWNCFDKKIWYSVEESRFICLANESETNSARKQYLINYVIENFDNISPITHENIYKRDYSYYSDITSDWNFRYFDWRDEDTLEIEFNDMSLNIQASLDIIETETWATILDFRINNIDVDEWNFDDKYYNNIETISEWVSISYGEGYSEVINNTSIENAVDYSEIINDTSIENAAEYSEIIHNISIEKIEKNEDWIITNAYIKTLSP